jgi:hypothetical protein
MPLASISLNQPMSAPFAKLSSTGVFTSGVCALEQERKSKKMNSILFLEVMGRLNDWVKLGRKD